MRKSRASLASADAAVSATPLSAALFASTARAILEHGANESSVRLQVNQAVWVQVVGATDASGVNCVVAGATSERVAIRFLDLKAAPSGVEPGASVMLRVTSGQGVHTAVASVVQVTLKPYVAITLRSPLHFTTTQNRKFFRVAVKLPVVCTIRGRRMPRARGPSMPRRGLTT